MKVQEKQINILKQLLNGWHLEPAEVEQAGELLERLNTELKTRKE